MKRVKEKDVIRVWNNLSKKARRDLLLLIDTQGDSHIPKEEGANTYPWNMLKPIVQEILKRFANTESGKMTLNQYMHNLQDELDNRTLKKDGYYDCV